MQRNRLWAFGLVLGTCTILVFPLEAAPVFGPHATDHVLVKFKPAAVAEFHAVPSEKALTTILARLNLPLGTALEEPVVSKLLRQNPGRAQPPAGLDFTRFFYLRLPPGLSVEACIQRLQNHPLVEYVEPDGIGHATFVPNDPEFWRQWNHQNPNKPSACIHTPDAWDLTQGSTNVIVAVVDSGLNDAAGEFFGRVLAGYNFAYTNTDTFDDAGHGTAVTSALGATGDNSILVAGVDWNCRIMPIKGLDQNESGFYSWWAQAIDFAVANGCRVINLSAGGSTSDTTLASSITNAIAHGVVFITTSGNGGANTMTFPGTLTNSITVGATDETDVRCVFSGTGAQIDLVAPGTNIFTVGSSGGLEVWWGTSLAAPQVSGVSAILLGLRPQLTPAQVHALLCFGAEDQVGDSSDTPGFDNNYGWGRLNAFNSILLAQTRIDSIQKTNNTILLSWSSPPNAATKHPYQVEYASTLSGPWTVTSTSANFSYQPGRTFWHDPNPATNSARFYRAGLKPL